MIEIDMNQQLAELLENHLVGVCITNNIISTDLPDPVKFKATAFYEENKGNFISRLDIHVFTSKGNFITESFGGIGATVKESVTNNLQNFSAGSLHPILASFGCKDPRIFDEVEVEEWEINGKIWKVYLGKYVMKILPDMKSQKLPPSSYFESIESVIKSQKLTNKYHWGRCYYCQSNNVLISNEFLMDNKPVGNTINIFDSLPIIPEISYYSCRIFFILKEKEN